MFPNDASDPGIDMIAATKHDTTNEARGPCRGIVFGGAGILKVTTIYGGDRTIPSGVLAAGIIHPLRVTRVWNTGTTATDVWLVY